MRKTNHHFAVYGTDDSRVTDFTRWKCYAIVDTRRLAWKTAKLAANDSGYRFVKIVEVRVFKGAD